MVSQRLGCLAPVVLLFMLPGCGDGIRVHTVNPTTTTIVQTPAPAPSSSPVPAGNNKVRHVAYVVDGDTIRLKNGDYVRFIGIDTPETGQCGHDEAKSNLEKLLSSGRVILTKVSGNSTDKYHRLLRYVNTGEGDVGLKQIEDGYAIARYDSTDGYPAHPRQNKYHRVDEVTRNFCGSQTTAQPQPEALYANCTEAREAGVTPLHIGDEGYDLRLDRNRDGVACE